MVVISPRWRSKSEFRVEIPHRIQLLLASGRTIPLGFILWPYESPIVWSSSIDMNES